MTFWLQKLAHESDRPYNADYTLDHGIPRLASAVFYSVVQF